MMKKIRIATGGFAHETNTFSPLSTLYEDFHEGTLTGTVQLEESLGDWQSYGVELIPTLSSHALPGGLVEKAAYLRLKEELLRAFERVLPLDGIHLDLHGAMEVEDIGDAEGDVALAVRELAGKDTLISVSLDLHGNISPTLVGSVNILTAYRTAPHRDSLDTRRRAMSLLVNSLKENKRPVSVLVKLPLLLAGEQAVTEVEPARSFYSRLNEFGNLPGIMDASLLMGCPWTDSPYTSCSVIVVAGEGREAALRHAGSFAGEVWEKRGDFKIRDETASVDEAIERAMEASEKPVFISDSGDNVTAGAPGDVTLIAKRLLDLGALKALVAGITDREAVLKCAAAGKGARIALSIGGKLDSVHSEPLNVRVKVEYVNRKDLALVNADGIRILLQADRRCMADRASIESGGIDPMKQNIVVVKQGYLFPDLSDHAPRAIIALSPGATDLRLERLKFKYLSRPIFPLDPDFTWSPGSAECKLCHKHI